jgi:hypothetical protein
LLLIFYRRCWWPSILITWIWIFIMFLLSIFKLNLFRVTFSCKSSSLKRKIKIWLIAIYFSINFIGLKLQKFNFNLLLRMIISKIVNLRLVEFIWRGRKSLWLRFLTHIKISKSVFAVGTRTIYFLKIFLLSNRNSIFHHNTIRFLVRITRSGSF